MAEWSEIVGEREIVVVANRLPLDRVTAPDGTLSWRPSPGGLVSAMEPVVRELGCVWVGWAGRTREVRTDRSEQAQERFAAAIMRELPTGNVGRVQPMRDRSTGIAVRPSQSRRSA